MEEKTIELKRLMAILKNRGTFILGPGDVLSASRGKYFRRISDTNGVLFFGPIKRKEAVAELRAFIERTRREQA